VRAAEAGSALPSLCAGSWLLTCDGVEKAGLSCRRSGLTKARVSAAGGAPPPSTFGLRPSCRRREQAKRAGAVHRLVAAVNAELGVQVAPGHVLRRPGRPARHGLAPTPAAPLLSASGWPRRLGRPGRARAHRPPPAGRRWPVAASPLRCASLRWPARPRPVGRAPARRVGSAPTAARRVPLRPVARRPCLGDRRAERAAGREQPQFPGALYGCGPGAWRKCCGGGC
jgi:hypothetical protein